MGSSLIRDQTHVSCIGRQILYHGATREAPKFGILRVATTPAPSTHTHTTDFWWTLPHFSNSRNPKLETLLDSLHFSLPPRGQCGAHPEPRDWMDGPRTRVAVTYGGNWEQSRLSVISISQKSSMQSALNKYLLNQIHATLLCMSSSLPLLYKSTNWKALCNSVSEPNTQHHFFEKTSGTWILFEKSPAIGIPTKRCKDKEKQWSVYFCWLVCNSDANWCHMSRPHQTCNGNEVAHFLGETHLKSL